MSAAELDRLLAGFLDTYSVENPGWGQFLDKAHHPQRGGLGTAAGALLCGMSNAGAPEMIDAVAAQLLQLSNNPEKRCQNVRLAWVYLGLAMVMPRLTDAQKADVGKVRQHLLAQKHGNGLWGAYWVSARVQDHQASIFATAFALLCLYLSSPTGADADIEALGRLVQTSYINNPKACEGFEPLVFAAICLSQGQSVDRRIGKSMRDFAWSKVSFSRIYINFYDYQQPDEQWGRDYIVVPIDLLVPLALRGHCPSLFYQLRALATLSELREVLNKNAGTFIGAEGKRPASFEQALAALAIQSDDRTQRTTQHIAWWRRWIFNSYYWLLRDRGRRAEMWGTGANAAVYILGGLVFVVVPLEQTQRWIMFTTFMFMSGINRLIKLLRGMVGRER